VKFDLGSGILQNEKACCAQVELRPKDLKLRLQKLPYFCINELCGKVIAILAQI
jgi:hypothetical protein